MFWLTMGVNYWMSDYLIEEIKMPKEQVFISFSVIAITGAIFGVLIGGKITACLGGYNNVKAFYVMALEGILCIFVAVPIPFLNNYIAILALLWLVLFMGAAILPGLSGVLLNTVDFELRTQAASISNVFYNFCGMLPAPFTFGAIA